MERGEDATRRRSNASDYLLSGRVVICAHCHSPYMGAAAHGRNARYRYYVCCSRQRGGLAKCSAERVPADPLEHGVLDSLAQTFAQPEVITRAVETARLELDLKRPDYAAELIQVQTEMRKADDSVQRYLLAFENGTLPEAMCGERMRALADRLGELRARQAELEAAVDESPADDPWANFDVSAVQAEVGRTSPERTPSRCVRRCCGCTSRRGGSRASTRSTRSSGCPRTRFDLCPGWWAHQGSNLRPLRCQRSARTN